MTVTSRLPRPQRCPVCGGTAFAHEKVLFPALTRAWALSADEEAYIDAQQGTHCIGCHANIRSMALAQALISDSPDASTLDAYLGTQMARGLRVLEVNEAGTLHNRLRQLPGHKLAAYPEYDLQHLALPDSAFDLVVHSDTLEHIRDPMKALAECRRVLAPWGRLAFTVPVIFERLSRSRAGLPPSFHGPSGCTEPGMLVHTEFGADCWTYVIRAGFSSCRMHAFCFPAGLAIVGEG